MDVKDAARAAALLAACGALAVTASGFVCAAANAGVFPCAGFCAARVWPHRPLCVAAPAQLRYEQQLYFAIVDTAYRPQRYASVRHPMGVLLLQAENVSGAQYLRDTTMVDAIRAAVRPESGDTLVLDFSKANAGARAVPDLWRISHRALDSATVRRLLTDSDAEVVKEPVAADLLAGLPADSLPGILGLSQAGMTPDGEVALVFASLRERQSREADHLEAAAFLVARRDGARWIVTHEIPVPRSRTP
jgi:hypothetical protein